jgi:hypothetical protein
MTSCCTTLVRVTTVELQTQECQMLTIIMITSSNQIDKPLHAINSLGLLVIVKLCYRILSASEQHCSVYQTQCGQLTNNFLIMLIPRHERWPVLMSTQGYQFQNMHFINSCIRRYEMSSRVEDTVSEDFSLLIEVSNDWCSFCSFVQREASCDCWFYS